MSENINRNHKLLVSIVKKGLAPKIVKASKLAGAEGGTVMIGRGSGIHECKKFFGITIEPEKEIILTLIEDEKKAKVLNAIIDQGGLKKPGAGIAFVINLSNVAGICHLCTGITLRRDSNMDSTQFDLIVSIVNKGHSETVVEASRKVGAEGGTILFGRGKGIHEQAKLFGITIEPEKELVLTLIRKEITEKVLNAILKEANLDKPGEGIAFVIAVEQVAGINHLISPLKNEKAGELNA